MTAPTRTTERRRGFTLIESIAAIVVLATLGSIASFLIVDNVDGFTTASNTSQLHAELSVAMDRAVRELRKIELDAGAAGVAPDIDDVTATRIAWTDSGGDAYELTLAGTDLTLQVDGGTARDLLTDVSAFTVTVYDESNASIALPLTGAACDPIRRVRLDVTLTRHAVSESLRAKVFLRCAMSGGST